MKQTFFYAILTIILIGSYCLGQETLKPNQEVGFNLMNKEEKTFILDLKKGDYAQLGWTDELARFPDFTLTGPSGESIVKGYYQVNPIPFVAKEDGKYKWVFKFEDTDSNRNGKVSVNYTNVLKLPKSVKLKGQKKVNGYDITIYNTSQDEKDGYGSYLLIKKGGRLVDILRGGSLVGGGFRFNENPADYDSAGGKRSAALFRSTLDKTGDGAPDIAVGFYSGGAHCCFDMHFYELGEDGVRKLKTVAGMDSDILAIGKTPKGGLILQTGDSTFAYWLTSFAGSPIPTVKLTYQDGEFRPDAKLMKKAPPTLTVLKSKAAKARKEIDLQPYTGEEEVNIMYAFWGEMLDLMYSGNETSAWQYFDLVWDARKPGKEKFKQDFLRKLNKSEYWQMMQGSK